MGQGDVKNPQTDKRVDNKSGNQGSGQKNQGGSRSGSGSSSKNK